MKDLFKKGDIVVNLAEVGGNCMNIGAIGIVHENNSACPYVLWEAGQSKESIMSGSTYECNKWAQADHKLEKIGEL
jgi:hypothetical protein